VAIRNYSLNQLHIDDLGAREHVRRRYTVPTVRTTLNESSILPAEQASMTCRFQSVFPAVVANAVLLPKPNLPEYSR